MSKESLLYCHYLNRWLYLPTDISTFLPYSLLISALLCTRINNVETGRPTERSSKMSRQGLIKVALVLALLSVAPTAGWASSNDGQNRRRQGPPPEAVQACEGKQAGASVEFSGRRGDTVEATCQERNGQLVAVPDNMPERGGRR